MFFATFDRVIIGIAGALAFVIGLAILIAPETFFAGYDVVLGTNPALLSELRAPCANLAALGALISAGAFYRPFTLAASCLGAVVFLAFAMGRLVGLSVDGWPGSGIVIALGIEMLVGLLCLWSFHRQREKAIAAENTAISLL